MHAAGIPLNKRDSRKADSVSLRPRLTEALSKADAVSLCVRLTASALRASKAGTHKSDDILDGDLDDVLKARRADGAFWSHFQQHNLPDYCLTYLGFRPDATAFKGSRLQTHAIISHIAQVEITYDTPHEIVVQYARAVALLLLGGVMCPDSSGNLIPLLYLTKLEDIVEARNYSWGSAVLAFLYRELCNATNKGKAAIGGALQLLHTTTVRVIRDILDEMQSDQLWRSSCPLIFYAIVEMHHPERVLRQFGMRQNIPEAIDTRDMSLHQISRKNRTGTDWNLQHIQYISRWQRRYDTVVQRPPISNRRDTERGYWECWSFYSIYAPSYYVPQPPQDDYVPQPPQDDWFQTAPYMPSHAQVHLDLGLGINQPYAPEYNISPVPFPSFSAYRDNVESSSAASSSRLHSNSGGDNNDEQNEPIDDMGEQIRRPRRQRHRRNCGTGGHF
ncbi:UNVERIFIED_CONTAM: protein MAINTENANCE OF MERISTEMS [Sesamum radiatum]|uniref:Protein MAINTENANCE OF MERISTEMS n=1 Tax=Sesamum radiatum TaxID=300843 RepID=A0AAW2LQY5_SESRA